MPPKIPARGTVSDEGRYQRTGRAVRVAKYVVTCYDEPWCSTGIPWDDVPEGIEYICGQPEINTTYVEKQDDDETDEDEVAQHRTHFQGVVITKEPQLIQEVRRLCGMRRSYFAPMGAGRVDAAIDYTKKDRTALVDEDGESMWRCLGSVPGNQKRPGEVWQTMLQMIKDGANMEALMDYNPGVAIRCASGLEKAIRTYQKPKMRKECQVCLITGKTRVGKTDCIYRYLENMDSVYKRVTAGKEGKGGEWWDGYEAHEAVLFDDFHPDKYDLNELLQILDKYPQQVPIKGSMRPACYTRVYITSNVPIENWYLKQRKDPNYQENFDALLARIPDENRINFVARVPADVEIGCFADLRNYQLEKEKEQFEEPATHSAAAIDPYVVMMSMMEEMKKMKDELKSLKKESGERRQRE
jgi:hypothetical protein